MQPVPERRYQSTQEMKADVDSARSPLPVAHPLPKPPPRLAKAVSPKVAKKTRAPLWIAAVAGLAVLLGVGVVWAKYRASPITAAGAASTPTTTAVWKPVVLTPDWVAKQGQASINADGELDTRNHFTLPGIAARDIILRAEIRKAQENHAIFLRHIHGGSNRFLAIYVSSAFLQMNEAGGKSYSVLSSVEFPAEKETSGKWMPFQFATVGGLSIAEVQSRVFSATSEKALQSGAVQLEGHIELRKIEVMILDGVPEAQWPEFIRTALQQPGAQP